MQAPLPYAVDNRLPDILDQVRQLFPRRREGDRTNPLDQLLYGVVAHGLSSAGATASYRRLREAFPSFAALRDADPEALRRLMVGVPAAALKAQALPEILAQIGEAFGSLTLDPLNRIDADMAIRFLTRLPRVTEDVAIAVLRLTGAERSVMSVGKDVARPLRRMALVERGAPLSALPRQLIERSPAVWRSDDFAALSRGLSRVADRWCHQGRPDCNSCPLASLCPTSEERDGSDRVVTFPSGQRRAAS